MLLSGLATVLGIAVVIGVIGVKLFRGGDTTFDVTALIPKGAKIVQTAVAGDYVVVTLDVGGATEIRSFDAQDPAAGRAVTFRDGALSGSTSIHGGIPTDAVIHGNTRSLLSSASAACSISAGRAVVLAIVTTTTSHFFEVTIASAWMSPAGDLMR